ncbi:putative RNA methyltransferase [Marinobacterium sp. YM272]|uniref:putative RNA methyltransferase n=1 Tax=Marinobacterium sp. YM272 TaxID=3421654 RepID=UPI003D7F8EAB
MIKLSCPVCQAPLTLANEDRQLRCDAGHNFDRARQGYWNLLLPQRKKSKNPGDSGEMIQARRRFLDAGYYWLIAERLTQLLVEQLEGVANPNLLDLGCGEGYYTTQIEEALEAAGLEANIAGLDISRDAVRSACQRSKNIDWLVATGADMPLPEASLDALTLMFSRVMPEPMAKVIRPGGLLLVVWPGPDHLIELRELIYDEVRRREFDPGADLEPLFEPVRTETLKFDFEVGGSEALTDLLEMTPHGHRIRSETRDRILTRESLGCHADIRFGLYRRQ